MALIGNRPLIWRLYDDSDEEDQNDFVIKEIRCCNCFFDLILSLISGKKKITFDFLYNKLSIPKTSCHGGDIFMYYSTISIFCCERSKIIFENSVGLDKEEMDRNCVAPLIDYCCLYFLSRETMTYSLCEGCRKTLVKNISRKLIIIKNGPYKNY